MPPLRLFKLYHAPDILAADWGIVQCPGLVVEKACQDIKDLKLLEPLRHVLPGSASEREILANLFGGQPGKWYVRVKSHRSLLQWIGDNPPHQLLIDTKGQARRWAKMVAPLQNQGFDSLDQAAAALQRLLSFSDYLPDDLSAIKG